MCSSGREYPHVLGGLSEKESTPRGDTMPGHRIASHALRAPVASHQGLLLSTPWSSTRTHGLMAGRSARTGMVGEAKAAYVPTSQAARGRLSDLPAVTLSAGRPSLRSFSP